MLWKNITKNWLTFPWSIYWIKVKLATSWFKRVWLLKLKWANTEKETCILLHPNTVKKWEYKIKRILLHEFSHYIFNTVLKTDIFEEVNNIDFKLSKFEYWCYLSRNLKHYITDYASTHSGEDFWELIWYSYYIENWIELPKKCTWNSDVKFKYIIAMNLYKHWLDTYLKKHVWKFNLWKRGGNISWIWY